MPADISGLLDDLAAEHSALDAMLEGRPESDWSRPTPAAGWDVTDTISHLYYFDGQACLAVTDAEAFLANAAEIFTGERPTFDVDPGRSMGALKLLDEWRRGRSELLVTLGKADPSQRVAWYGPAMSLASFTTARIMETWAHGMDVADALGAAPIVSDRLRHVAHIAYGARAYSYMANGREVPSASVRLEVTAPSGAQWSWGQVDATNVVRAGALDFALLTTQRRHRDDVTISTQGPLADEWMSIAQTFAGPSGGGRQPGARPLS
jgi:uncharacterized protein (TIGR03084 family)